MNYLCVNAIWIIVACLVVQQSLKKLTSGSPEFIHEKLQLPNVFSVKQEKSCTVWEICSFKYDEMD